MSSPEMHPQDSAPQPRQLTPEEYAAWIVDGDKPERHASHEVTAEQLDAQKHGVEEVITAAGNRLVLSSQRLSERGANRAQGPALTQAERDIKDILVGGSVVDIIDQAQKTGESPEQTEAKIDDVLAAADTRSREQRRADSDQEGRNNERSVATGFANKIRQGIMSSEAAKQAFADGGEAAFQQYITDQFANNPRLRKIAEKLEGFDRADERAQKEIQVPGKEIAVYTESEESSGTALDTYESKELVVAEAQEVEKSEATVDPELLAKMEAAADKYAELTARDRKSYFIGRYMKTKQSFAGKVFGKIPGIQRFKDSLNEKQGAEITDARTAYQEAIAEMQVDLARKIKDIGGSDKDVLEAATLAHGDADLFFESVVISHREMQSKPAGKLTNWWVRQQGFKGNLKKFGVVAGTGAVVGLGGGVVLPVWAAGLAAGAAGAYIGNRVTRRRANAVGEDGFNVAERQAMADVDTKQAMLDGALANSSNERPLYVRPEHLTAVTESRSDQEAFENRSRVRKAFAAGKLGFIGVSAIREGVQAGLNALDSDTPNTPATTEPTVPEKTGPADKPKPKFYGEKLNVEAGSGYINEMRQLGESNGIRLSDEQWTRVYERVAAQNVDTQGRPRLVDIGARGVGDDSYRINGSLNGNNYGISAPDATARWYAGVDNDILRIAREMEENSK